MCDITGIGEFLLISDSFLDQGFVTRHCELLDILICSNVLTEHHRPVETKFAIVSSQLFDLETSLLLADATFQFRIKIRINMC